jgi:serine/threonine-protein kinase
MAELRALEIVSVTLDQRIGTVLGGYRIIEPLGSGGTSVVYRAEHVRLGRPAALKLLAPGLGEADFSERFLRESQLAASLDHPSIVPIYDAGEEDGLLYIAMACVEGSDLKTLLGRENRLPTRRALRIIGQIGAALEAAHTRGLVHRDVKPANILVAADDRAYLSDFGVVKELASNGSTRTGSFIGTIDYCAPEQIEGGDVDARTDVYALACVLYECLAGTPPFHRPSEVAVLNAHLHAPPPKLTRAAPDAPPALEHVISKALSKSPLDRYASTGEFLNAARAAAAERRVHRRRLAVSVSLLVLASLIGAVAALAVRAVAFGDESASAPPAPPPPRQQSPSLSQLLLASDDGGTLNDVAYSLLVAHQYKRALPFAQKAVQKVEPGTVTEGYANFNLGYTLFRLGRCAESVPRMRKALDLEPAPQRPYIRLRIKQAKRCAQHAASSLPRSR